MTEKQKHMMIACTQLLVLVGVLMVAFMVHQLDAQSDPQKTLEAEECKKSYEETIIWADRGLQKAGLTETERCNLLWKKALALANLGRGNQARELAVEVLNSEYHLRAYIASDIALVMTSAHVALHEESRKLFEVINQRFPEDAGVLYRYNFAQREWAKSQKRS